MTAVLIAPFALLGATALYLLIGWLACAIVASYLSERKGYTDRPGLAAGLILYPLGPIIFLLIPAKQDSAWRKQGCSEARSRAAEPVGARRRRGAVVCGR